MNDLEKKVAELNEKIAVLAESSHYVLELAMTALGALQRDGKLTLDEIKAMGEFQKKFAATLH